MYKRDGVLDVTTLPRSARPTLIVCGRGKRGKALTHAILRALLKDGIVEVAALSENGVENIARVGQAVANSIGDKVTADPIKREIEIAPGQFKAALVIQFTIGAQGTPEAQIAPETEVYEIDAMDEA